MENYTIALFGEAEKGHYRIPYYCTSLAQLDEYFGNPPEDSLGIFYAIQALMFRKKLLFFRVNEEGFSFADYLSGFQLLSEQDTELPQVRAICLPGVGNSEIIDIVHPYCLSKQAVLIMNQSDLYDYLTANQKL